MQCMLNHSYHWKIQTAVTFRVSKSQEDMRCASRLKVCIVFSVFFVPTLATFSSSTQYFFLSFTKSEEKSQGKKVQKNYPKS